MFKRRMFKSNKKVLIDSLERILKPKYMNEVFTWAEIERAIKSIKGL